jgi:LPS sulfotransferase NodH
MERDVGVKNLLQSGFYSNVRKLPSFKMSILEKFPPIFILGSPRSGSTLAMQVITQAFNLGYISNFHCKNLFSPKHTNEDFKRKIEKRTPSDFESYHGDAKGETAPAECGNWWYQFFRVKPTFVTLKDVDEEKMLLFRKKIEEMTHAFNKPIVFKNLYASLRLQVIGKYLPQSLFIIMKRNEVDNAHSLLEGRHNVYGNYETWWSMEPPQITKLKRLPAHEQVIEQIRHIHRTINSDLDYLEVPSTQRLDVYYEELCEKPREIINLIGHWTKMNACELNIVGSVPSKFKQRDEIRIDKSVYEKMMRYAEKFV